MQPHNRKKLSDRVIKAAEVALAARKYVSPIDVLVGIGWLDPGAVKRWQQGQFDHLEGAVQTNLPRISEAMKLFRSWATAKGLIPSETHYVAQTPSRRTLRFSKSGNPTIEKLYRTHWISGDLSENEQEHLVERTSRAPELVVIEPLHDSWTCHRCGSSGGLLVMENPGPACHDEKTTAAAAPVTRPRIVQRFDHYQLGRAARPLYQVLLLVLGNLARNPK